MKVDYEEKTYESFFNTELSQRCQIYFPLGQVQEGYLGFDTACYSKSRFVWSLLSHRMLSGQPVNDVVDYMEDFLKKEITSLPPFKANIIFQYKKPQYITISSGKEWKHWKQAYYRYEIYQRQQNLLKEIHQNFANKVLVIYASPAINSVNMLVDAHKNKKIISQSNFTKAIDLCSHDHNTYTLSGSHSIACSEPTSIDKIDLVSTIQQLGNNSNQTNLENTNNIRFITDFCSSIRNTISENEYYRETFNTLNTLYSGLQDSSLLQNIISLQAVREITGIQWLITY